MLGRYGVVSDGLPQHDHGPGDGVDETASRVAPGRTDAVDAAICWSINVHPVKFYTSTTGRRDLEQCFKSCLASSCGCDDAPGMKGSSVPTARSGFDSCSGHGFGVGSGYGWLWLRLQLWLWFVP